jgi:galactitol PTS system EIIA component
MSKIFVVEKNVDNWEEALKCTGKTLYENNCVVEEFAEKCIERERSYPTGLIETIPVAIPHASKDYVREQAICCLRLEKPVKFHSMEDWDMEVNVRYVLNLALLDDSEHIKIITRVIRSLKDPQFLVKMDNCNPDQLKTLLEDYFLSDKLDDAA